jgi:tetratricopeptide (TPR) repeat protein
MLSKKKDISWVFENLTEEENKLLEEGKKSLSDSEKTILNKAVNGNSDALDKIYDDNFKGKPVAEIIDGKEQVPAKQYYFAYSLAQTTKDPRMLNSLGAQNSCLAEYEKSEALLNKALETGNDKVKRAAYHNLGGVEQNKGKFKKALPYYLKSLELADDREDKANLHYNMGVCYFSIGKVEKAIEHFGFALYTDDKELQNLTNHALAASNLINDGKFSPKVELYLKKNRELGNETQKALINNLLSEKYAKTDLEKAEKVLLQNVLTDNGEVKSPSGDKALDSAIAESFLSLAVISIEKQEIKKITDDAVFYFQKASDFASAADDKEVLNKISNNLDMVTEAALKDAQASSGGNQKDKITTGLAVAKALIPASKEITEAQERRELKVTASSHDKGR